MVGASPKSEEDQTVDLEPAPLIVDLDRTFLRSDTLIEQFLSLLFRAPFAALSALRRLSSGRAAFKEEVISRAPLSGDGLAVNEELLDYLVVQRGLGRKLHLVTAADQRVADVVAEKFGIFRSAVGSSEGYNLKGHAKRDYLVQTFPDGYAYAGDSRADIPIWESARGAVLVGVGHSVRQSVGKMGITVEKDLPRQKIGIKTWLRLVRAHQWSKNILVFVPLMLSQLYTSPPAVLAALVSFFGMCLVASGTYIINDIVDLQADREHPTKRFRPIANGAVNAGLAFVFALVLIGAGLLAALSVNLAVAGAFVLYLVTALAYSFWLKRIAMVDIFVLASLYSVRLAIGIYAIGAVVSVWLLMFSFFFFFSLSLAKRHGELVMTALHNPGQIDIKNRGYRTTDAPFTLATGVATNAVAMLILGLYIANDIYPAEDYGDPRLLWGVVGMVMLWSTRIWLLSQRGELDDDPVSFALKDRVSLIIGGLTAVLFVLSVV
jgi:4-hydroxybenzoate polyprenyltransferase